MLKLNEWICFQLVLFYFIFLIHSLYGIGLGPIKKKKTLRLYSQNSDIKVTILPTLFFFSSMAPILFCTLCHCTLFFIFFCDMGVIEYYYYWSFSIHAVLSFIENTLRSNIIKQLGEKGPPKMSFTSENIFHRLRDLYCLHPIIIQFCNMCILFS